MTMTETPTPPPAPAKPKRKWTRKPKPAAAAPPSEFAGLTVRDCCDDCNEKKCVISGINVCGHPMKGGIQSAQMGKPDVLKRYNRAKRVLGEQKLKVD